MKIIRYFILLPLLLANILGNFFTIKAGLDTIDSVDIKVMNGTYYILYLVKSELNAKTLSQYFSLDEQELMKANPYIKTLGSTKTPYFLKIPYTFKQKINTQKPEDQPVKYTLKVEENIYDLAKRFDMDISEFRKINTINTSILEAGTEILVKNNKEIFDQNWIYNKPKAFKKPRIPKQHTVKKDENLYRIALKYQVEIDSLIKWNALGKTRQIYIGQNLIVGYEELSSSSHSERKKEITKNSREESDRTNAHIPQYVSEEGLAIAIKGRGAGDNTKKLLALHATLKHGTLIKVINLENNIEILVKVIGQLQSIPGQKDVILKLSEAACKKLGAINERFRVKIEYNR